MDTGAERSPQRRPRHLLQRSPTYVVFASQPRPAWPIAALACLPRARAIHHSLKNSNPATMGVTTKVRTQRGASKSHLLA